MDTRKYFFLQLAYFIALTFLISSCGGSGGGSSSGPATPPASTFSFTKQVGSVMDDRGNAVSVDSGGNIYVTGSTGGGLDGNTNAGASDIFLIKYDSAGNKQWTRQLGSANYDEGKGVAVDTSGNVYITGYTYGDLDGNTNAGGADIFLVKYDSAGNKQWTRQLGNNRDDKGFGVTVDTSGNIDVCGFYDGWAGASPYTDIFLVKYDSAGNKQWTRQVSGGEHLSPDSANGVTNDNSGYIYVTGQTYGPLLGSTFAGDADIFLVKYDSAGIVQWTRQLGSLHGDVGNGVAVGNSGNIYVTGNTQGGLDGNTNAGGIDIFLAKYSSIGVKQ